MYKDFIWDAFLQACGSTDFSEALQVITTLCMETTGGAASKFGGSETGTLPDCMAMLHRRMHVSSFWVKNRAIHCPKLAETLGVSTTWVPDVFSEYRCGRLLCVTLHNTTKSGKIRKQHTSGSWEKK